MTREQHAQRQEQADKSQCLVTSKGCNHGKGLGFSDSEEATARL